MKKNLSASVEVAVEEWMIPTYPIPEAEEMPMFSELCVHQGTTATPAISCHQVMLGTLIGLPVTSRRKVGMTSSHHGSYELGYTRATLALTEGSEGVSWSKS